jgi:hypothetical protein
MHECIDKLTSMGNLLNAVVVDGLTRSMVAIVLCARATQASQGRPMLNAVEVSYMRS